jgi:large subunit ribosomal protein L7/L12
MTKEKIIEEIEKMSVLELSELVKDLEDKFGVTAMAPISAVAAASGAVQAASVEEKTEFDVVLNGFDAAKKINVIKAIREVMQLGLKESKDLVEAAEKEVQKIKESLPKKDAEELKKKLEEAGAKVELK